MRIRLGAGALAALCGVAFAQSSGGPHVMRKDVVAHGGGTAAAASYQATVTVAQPVAGRQSGGSYVLTGGFHSPASTAGGRIFCDGFEDTPCP